MRSRLLWATLGLGLVLTSLLAAPVAHGQNKFRLKPGAGGQVCLDCHADMA